MRKNIRASAGNCLVPGRELCLDALLLKVDGGSELMSRSLGAILSLQSLNGTLADTLVFSEN